MARSDKIPFPKVEPLAQEGMFFCPVCDCRITNKVSKHPYCEVSFIWKQTKLKKLPIQDSLQIARLTPSHLCKSVGLTQSSVYRQFQGQRRITPKVLNVLIKELEAFQDRNIKTLKILKRLKEDYDV